MSTNRIALTSSMTLVDELLRGIQTISNLNESVVGHKKSCWNLARRIKLLAPLFEEIREVKSALPPLALVKFQELRAAFSKAKDIMEECNNGSRLHLILEREAMELRFRSLTTELSNALKDLPLDLLAVSDEIREQVELVQQQLKRHKNTEDLNEELIQSDLKSLLSDEREGAVDIGKLEMLMKLGLNSLPAILKEKEALEKQRSSAWEKGIPTKHLNQALNLLGRLHLSLGGSESDFNKESSSSRVLSSLSSSSSNPATPAPPEDFKCPISLELMRDPVIVSTGQTYDRMYIEQWLKDGHKTCPKTQQVLSHPTLIPNYSLRSLIQQWCDANGVQMPMKQSKSSLRLGSSFMQSSNEVSDRSLILNLKERLRTGSLEVQRSAVAEIRSLAKRSVSNRACIAEVGTIPLLVSALTLSDQKIQEHAVTALLNLSINDPNKNLIVAAGAVEPIVNLLKHGSMEARENAAATLFSLSVIDENKISIGQSGAIPALVDLLQKGSPRGKKDAATALFNLSIYQGNKARAVRAGIVPPLMQLLNHDSGMTDEALAILAVLVNSPEGRNAINCDDAVPVLVDWISSGSSRTKENAASVLLSLCQNAIEHTAKALRINAVSPLRVLLRNGTPRAKRKASQLLQHFHEFEQDLSFTP